MIDAPFAFAGHGQLIRLDPNVIPLRYKLDFLIDPSADGFAGDSKIEISLGLPSRHIVLHGLDLVFESIEIEDEVSVQIVKATKLADDGTLTLDFPREVSQGKATLHFKYRAAYSKSLEGIYKVIDDGKPSVFTQFQAIGARRAFPSFDEPGFKATFDVTISAPQKYQVISNTIEVGSLKAERQHIIHHFATTMPLPTYLVAIAVGDFDVVDHAPIAASNLRKHPIPLRGIAVRGRGDDLKAALDITARLVLAEEKYFGIAYPFDKFDIIAVPDFGAGGMENAGAITYDENLALLGDDATLQRRREFLTTHAHEIAHQWFGNLVTPKWWDDLWLNESFATLMETKFASQMEPDWGFETDILKSAHEAMIADGASSVRRVHEPVTSVDGITAAFDAITYQKGATILAMIEATVGEDAFRGFVHEFLKSHAFKSVDSQEFVAALRHTKNGKLAAETLISFIENPGLPVLKVGNNGTLIQSRFLSKDQGPTMPWTVPMINSGNPILPADNVPRYYVFDVSRADWLVMLASVPKMPKAQALAVATSFDLAYVEGRVTLQDYLDGVKNLAQHPDWDIAGFPLERLEFIENETSPLSPVKQTVQTLIRDIYGPKLKKIGITRSLESKHVTTWILELQREHLVEVFAASGADPALKSQLAKLGFELIKDASLALDDTDLVPADVIESALIAAAKTGGREFLHISLARLRTSDDGHEREIWLHAIAASHAEDSSIEIEKLLLSEEIRNQEIPTLLFARTTIPSYRDATWDIVERNHQALIARLSGDLEITLVQIAESFASEDLAHRVEASVPRFLGHLRGGAVQLNQALERIRLNAAMVSRLEMKSTQQ